MTHRLFTLVIKAEDQDDAIKKAKHIMDKYFMGGEYNMRDSYCIVGHEDKSDPNRGLLDFENRVESQLQQTGATIISHEFQQEGCVRVSRLDSPHGQEFFKKPFDDRKKAQKIVDSDDKNHPLWFDARLFVIEDYTYNEEGKPITNELSYLEAAKDYFVVPVDVHS